MAEKLRYVIADIGIGWVGIISSARGLARLTLPQVSAIRVNQLLGDQLKTATRSPKSFHELLQRLRLYFAGDSVTFADELDLSTGTVFQRQVWEKTRLIPRGETRSYGWVAEQIGHWQAARAVGQALARNPIPIIVPCHRVVAARGKLGGYGGGPSLKRHLIRLESGQRPLDPYFTSMVKDFSAIDCSSQERL